MIVWGCYLIACSVLLPLMAALALNLKFRNAVLAKFHWLQQSDTAAPYFSYNAAHCLGGMVAIWLGLRWTPFDVWQVAAITLLVCASKEFIYDRCFELPFQTNKLDATDFAGYTVGVVIGTVIERWL